MAQILESVMLICFGISWPISLAKNLKARSAKNMSLQFILMIIIGYCAGIAAKLITHNLNYVLVIYLFNLIVVVCNLIVYFINLQQDRMAACKFPEVRFDVADRPRKYEITKQEQIYKEMNPMQTSGSIVFFGSDLFAQLPARELTETFALHEQVVNRSIAHCSIDAMSEALPACVLELAPSKVFLNIGDYDLTLPDFDPDNFIAKYNWILYTIHAKTNASLYLVSVMSPSAAAAELNRRLKALATEYGVEYIDATCVLGCDRLHIRLFELLKFYMRSHPISFGDAMHTLSVS